MDEGYLDGVNVPELSQAAAERRKMILLIRTSDGELHDLFGGPILPGSAPACLAKGSWYWKEQSVYVNHNGSWKKVSAPTKFMILQIVANDGTFEVLGNPIAASDPDVAPKGSWYWKTSSPGCVYVNHFGVWKKVCD